MPVPWRTGTRVGRTQETGVKRMVFKIKTDSFPTAALGEGRSEGKDFLAFPSFLTETGGWGNGGGVDSEGLTPRRCLLFS